MNNSVNSSGRGSFSVVPFTNKKIITQEETISLESQLQDYGELSIDELLMLFIHLAKDLGYPRIAVVLETKSGINESFINSQIINFHEKSTNPETTVEDKLELIVILQRLSEKLEARDRIMNITSLIAQASSDTIYKSEFPPTLKVDFHNFVRGKGGN